MAHIHLSPCLTFWSHPKHLRNLIQTSHNQPTKWGLPGPIACSSAFFEITSFADDHSSRPSTGNSHCKGVGRQNHSCIFCALYNEIRDIQICPRWMLPKYIPFGITHFGSIHFECPQVRAEYWGAGITPGSLPNMANYFPFQCQNSLWFVDC